MSLHHEGDPTARLFDESGFDRERIEMRHDPEAARLQTADILLEESRKFDLRQLEWGTQVTLESPTDGNVTMQIIQDGEGMTTGQSRCFVVRVTRSNGSDGFKTNYVALRGPSSDGHERIQDRQTVAQYCDIAYVPVVLEPFFATGTHSQHWLSEFRSRALIFREYEEGFETRVVEADRTRTKPFYFRNVSGGYYGPDKTPIFPPPGQNTVS